MLETLHATLQERVFAETLPNGLLVYLLPKPGFAKTYAMFTTRYGSIDNHFHLEGQEPVRVPDGIAHFLEHKLFEEPEGDVFSRFASQGANANAFTTHTRTSYLFSATTEIAPNLATLLDFVQAPYLTPENVEKEKGIIEQEIRMYEDQAFWRGYRALMEGMFQAHPVRLDIAGSLESVHAITVDELMTCYRTFYHPSNMVLVIVGDFEPAALMAQVRENQGKKSYPPQPAIFRHYPAEPPGVGTRRQEIRMAIAKPLVLLGYKEQDAGLTGTDLVKRELVTRVLMDAVFGKSSELYRELDDEGLIDHSYGYDYEAAPWYSFAYVGGESEHPETLIERIDAGLLRARRDGISAEAFDRARRRKLGEYLRIFDSPEMLSYEFSHYLLLGADLYQVPALMDGLTPALGQERLELLFEQDQRTTVLVHPNP